MTSEYARARNRLVAMAVANLVALLAAGGFAVGYFVRDIGWMLPAFIAALAVGFGVQIWFITGLGRNNKGA